MTTNEPLFEALKRLEHADLPPTDREILRPAFAALHGGQAIALPERVVHRIRALDAQLSVSPR
ncbi:hypothetical protein [Paraburkholderia rhynchosiae]|uniref:Uncharacterized protein n=1 Tax=Paraburkholderia rhynchosiae TaxID=487049 RepID=A0A6J5CBN2_9BURK|nr:hypothetical protein [Paraburkholderia rhynchosiae]CAB3730449.1 hypothetical protein LMG27174_05745 [Paraburkholderia rhynchosiae]